MFLFQALHNYHHQTWPTISSPAASLVSPSHKPQTPPRTESRSESETCLEGGRKEGGGWEEGGRREGGGEGAFNSRDVEPQSSRRSTLAKV